MNLRGSITSPHTALALQTFRVQAALGRSFAHQEMP